VPIRIGINGFGRIGRAFVRRSLEYEDVDVVAINDITDARTLAHLLAFDSTYGKFAADVEHNQGSISVNGKPIAALTVREPAAIGWGERGVDVVIESTGKFRSRDDAALHLKGGAQGPDFGSRKGRRPHGCYGSQRRRLRSGAP